MIFGVLLLDTSRKFRKNTQKNTSINGQNFWDPSSKVDFHVTLPDTDYIVNQFWKSELKLKVEINFVLFSKSHRA